MLKNAVGKSWLLINSCGLICYGSPIIAVIVRRLFDRAGAKRTVRLLASGFTGRFDKLSLYAFAAARHAVRADRAIIYGRDSAVEQLVELEPIRYRDGIVGYLGILPGKTPSQPGELRFIECQTKAFVRIALLMILLPAFLAWLLAYILGRPLKRITTAAKALAIGRYDARLPVEPSDELGHLARDFNELATALERSEQSRRRWVADISHELRTPLAVLHGELEALQDGIRPLTAEAVDSLLGDVMRLNRLTEDLYQLALSDQGALIPFALLNSVVHEDAPGCSAKALQAGMLTQREDVKASPCMVSGPRHFMPERQLLTQT